MTDAEVMDRHYKAQLVQRYRANPRGWPDGIDPKGGVAWYEDGSSWTEERIKLALDSPVFRGEKARPKLIKTAEKAGAEEEKPWVKLGISRRTYFYRRKAKGSVEGSAQ